MTNTWRTFRRFADLTPQPWANGRGTTVELVSAEESVQLTDATVGTGRWRLSLASLQEEGPFSPLPGMDRIHTPLDAIELTVDGIPHRIPALTPFAFDGGAATSLTGLPCPTRAVNLMVEQGDSAVGRLTVQVVDAGAPVTGGGTDGADGADRAGRILAAVALDGTFDLVVPHTGGGEEFRDLDGGTSLVVVTWEA